MINGIGNTPLIKVHDGVDLLFKLEGSNLFGSVKDRAAEYIIEKGLAKDTITSDTEIIESSSGNFAIALAGVCRIYNIKFTCVIDPLISETNLKILKIFCADIIIADIADENGGYVKERIKIVKSKLSHNKTMFCLNQYSNSIICKAYENTIGKEIATLDRVDYIFVVTSTCGTIAGVSAAVKSIHSHAMIKAVDVEGSKIFRESCGNKKITGVGASFTPENLKRAIIDDVVIVQTTECINGCEELLKYGIFAGGSSGVVYATCKKYSRTHKLVGKKSYVFCLIGASVIWTQYTIWTGRKSRIVKKIITRSVWDKES